MLKLNTWKHQKKVWGYLKAIIVFYGSMLPQLMFLPFFWWVFFLFFFFFSTNCVYAISLTSSQKKSKKPASQADKETAVVECKGQINTDSSGKRLCKTVGSWIGEKEGFLERDYKGGNPFLQQPPPHLSLQKMSWWIQGNKREGIITCILVKGKPCCACGLAAGARAAFAALRSRKAVPCALSLRFSHLFMASATWGIIWKCSSLGNHLTNCSK